MARAQSKGDKQPRRPEDRYWKVSRRLWADEWWTGLGSPPCTPHTVWLALLTSLPGPVPGLAPVGIGHLLDLCGWEPEEVSKALTPIEEAARVKRSRHPALIWLPNAVRHNQPTATNQVTGWAQAIRAMPECELRNEAADHIENAIRSEDLRRAFRCALDTGQRDPGYGMGQAKGDDDDHAKGDGKGQSKAHSGSRKQEAGSEDLSSRSDDRPGPDNGSRSQKQQACWDDLRAYRTNNGRKPPTKAQGHLGAAFELGYSVEDFALLHEYVFTADDEYAETKLRNPTSGPNGKTPKKGSYTNWGTIWNGKLPERMTRARDWRDAGKPKAPEAHWSGLTAAQASEQGRQSPDGCIWDKRVHAHRHHRTGLVHPSDWFARRECPWTAPFRARCADLQADGDPRDPAAYVALFAEHELRDPRDGALAAWLSDVDGEIHRANPSGLAT